MHHAFKLADDEVNVELSRRPDAYCLHVGDRRIPVQLERNGASRATLTVAGDSEVVFIATRGDDVFVHVDGTSYQLRYEHPLERLAHKLHGAEEDSLRAPMPGSLVAIHVKAGQAVARGDALLVMESMKMETTLAAPRDGIVNAVHFGIAQSFDRDAVLLSLEPDNPLPREAGEGRRGGARAPVPPGLPSVVPQGLPSVVPQGLPSVVPQGLPSVVPQGLPSVAGGGRSAP